MSCDTKTVWRRFNCNFAIQKHGCQAIIFIGFDTDALIGHREDGDRPMLFNDFIALPLAIDSDLPLELDGANKG
jgi:hypothetical protein